MAGDQRATEPTAALRSDEIDTTVAHPARLYDYLLGGKDNYQADRDAAERAYANYPDGIEGVRLHALTQRSFLARTVGPSSMAAMTARARADREFTVHSWDTTHNVMAEGPAYWNSSPPL